MVFFYPKKIETSESKISGEVSVVKLFGTYRIIVAGFTQSGGLVKTIWQKSLNQIKTCLPNKPKILILGLGAGSSASIASKLWPDCTITGIEIDPAIIRLANKYFKLKDLTQLKIEINDAFLWLKNAKKKRAKFDLILVDIYIGASQPLKVKSQDFYEDLSSKLKKNGLILFNQLVKSNNKQQINQLQTNLEKAFGKVKKIKTPANIIYKVQIRI